ncbi:PIN domain-containing protein [Xenorhabdus doucetiae]|uniref:PIN domain-containing protein n=1 Tax=Xenorhabdus doucetiae TaxID=351671 RepID=A0A068QTP5_9GAMM|nr:PIN domain-containing protein [Xenorhabdus doucetiae]TYP15944.1 PIN domain-containing protein [Xenorhabdus doucetiae]CDG18026.1 conserved protein of unknown function [Xenorhabdus doucetiae]
MTHSPYPVLLDACVLYPARLRDLLMHLGLCGLYQPKWTVDIHEEWKRNLLINRSDLTVEQLNRVQMLMDRALPDANVIGYDLLIPSINLIDKNDRHVLAAAIQANAEIIVTYNLKDFPADYLSTFGIEAFHPDDFVSDIIDLNHAISLQSINNLRNSLKKPPLTIEEFLASLSQIGMAKTVKALESYKFML